MANRMRDDEKNERIIRGLLKLPPNRRCINCSSLGPQYVCTNFWTFICTNCSGLHREFTHRVKSISMAKFTSQEVTALQEGGNERAREIYFKEWDSQRQSVPDSSNIDRLREFIKHVYVDRRFTGEKAGEKPPRMKGDKEEYNENRREDSYRSDSRSPPYDERRYSDRPGSGGSSDERKFRSGYGERSPAYDQDDRKRSPANNGNQNRSFEDRRFPDRISRPEGMSPSYQKDVDASSPPVVRPVRDILGANVPPLRVGEPPKSNGIRAINSPPQAQSTTSSSSRGSSAGNAVELKKVNLGSLIDFDADPEPPVAVAPPQALPQQTASLPTNSGGWASFDISPQHKAPQVASNVGLLESAFAQVSAPGSSPVVGFSTLPVSGIDPFPQSNNGGQWPTMQQHQLLSTSTPFSAPTVGALTNQIPSQSWGSTLSPSLQVPVSAPGQASQINTRPPSETSAGALSQVPVETKPTGRKELPQDLFAALYSPVPTPFPGWQTGAHMGMGYGMQYPTSMRPQTFPQQPQSFPRPQQSFSQPPQSFPQPSQPFPQSSVSNNPFDTVNESSPRHASTFPSMGSLQGALPNVNNPSALHASTSFAAPQWIPPQQPSYPSSLSPSPYMVQQRPSNMPQQGPNNLFPTGHSGFASEGATFGSSTINHHSAAGSQMGSSTFVPSVGGNPFG